MSDRAQFEPPDSELHLDDPWTIWGLEMGRLMRAAGIPPDEDLLQSVASLARLRQEVETKEAALAGAPARNPLVGHVSSAPVLRFPAR